MSPPPQATLMAPAEPLGMYFDGQAELVAEGDGRLVILAHTCSGARALRNLGAIAIAPLPSLNGATAAAANLLSGRTVSIFPDNSNEGRAFSEFWLPMLADSGAQASKLDVSLPEGHGAQEWAKCHSFDDLRAACRPQSRSSGSPPAGARPQHPGGSSARAVSRPLSTVTEERVDYLWPGRVPFGMITMFEGDPATGKSTVACNVAARFSQGAPMPGCGASGGIPGNSLILAAEDHAGNTIRPRLVKAGANIERVHILTHVEDPAGYKRALTLPTDIIPLRRRVEELSIRLVIVDPLIDFFDRDIHQNSEQDVRGVMAALAEMAGSTGCAIVLLRHLTKDATSPAKYRGLGSIGVIAAARSGFVFGPDRGEPSGRRIVMAHVKCNVAALAPSLAFELSGAPGEAASVTWHGTSPMNANQLLSVVESQHSVSRLDEAKAFLLDALSGGPRPYKALQHEFLDAGHVKVTVDRAKYELGITSRKVGPGWVWELPREQGHQPSPPSPSDDVDVLADVATDQDNRA